VSQKIVDHTNVPVREPKRREGDPVLIEAVDDHLRAFGPGLVVHDHDSRWVHVDVFMFPATPERAFGVTVTCGMAERPLTDITGRRVWTELCCVLPASWPFTGQPAHFWPMSLMRWIARMPHETGTGFAAGDTLGPIPRAPETVPLYPFEAALFQAQPLIAPLAMVGRDVTFLAMCPLYLDELHWARAHGSRVLVDAFTARAITPWQIDPARPSLAPPP
jgi:hypothetical protein